MYGVSLVSVNFDICSAADNAELYVVSYVIGPR